MKTCVISKIKGVRPVSYVEVDKSWAILCNLEKKMAVISNFKNKEDFFCFLKVRNENPSKHSYNPSEANEAGVALFTSFAALS